MDYICPICKRNFPRELQIVIPHTEEHVIEEIKKRHPNWAEKDGTCVRCYEYYKKQISLKK